MSQDLVIMLSEWKNKYNIKMSDDAEEELYKLFHEYKYK